MNALFRSIKDTLLKYRWNIAITTIDDLMENGLKNIKILQHPYKDRWYADPFILNIDETYIYVLVEELYYHENRGKITYLKINRSDFRLEDSKVILELPTHLSFPFIYRANDKIYIIPESHQSGKWTVYQFDEMGISLRPITDIIDLPLTDAIIHQKDGIYYLLSTQQSNPNGSELSIYTSDKAFSDYQLQQKISFSDATARNAGNIFSYKGSLYRPAQDCTLRYGHGVVLQKINWEGKNIQLEESRRWYPTALSYNQGLHTLNVFQNIAIIDLKGYCHPITAKFLTHLKEFIRK